MRLKKLVVTEEVGLGGGSGGVGNTTGGREGRGSQSNGREAVGK